MLPSPLRRMSALSSAGRKIGGSAFSLFTGGLLLTLVMALLVLPTLITLFVYAFSAANSRGELTTFTVENFTGVASQKNLLIAGRNSFVFSALSTVVSIALGGCLAWLSERSDAPFPKLTFAASIVSMGTPYILYATAWIFLLGRAGPFNQVYMWLVGSNDIAFNVHSMAGMVLIGALLWTPLTFLLLSAVFRAANADMEEAARVAGASILTTIRRVTLGLARPAILALAMLVFIRSLEAFEVPALVGMPAGIDVLTTDIYRAMTETPPRLGHTSAFSILLLVAVSSLLYFYGRFSREAERYASVTGKSFRPRRFALGRWRWVAGFFVIACFVVVIVLPILALLWIALTPFIGPLGMTLIKGLTVKHFVAVLTNRSYGELVYNTIVVSTVAATLTVLIALVAGWFAVRRQPFGKLIDQLATIPLVYPGIVLGIAVLQIGLAAPFGLYGTLWLIVIAFVIGYIPHAMRYAYSGVLQIHKDLEEASSASGASAYETISRIVVPLCWPSLLAGWTFVFLACSRELTIPVLLAGADTQTVAVAMLSLWGYGQAGEVAALGLLWAALMTVVAGVLYSVTRRLGATFMS